MTSLVKAIRKEESQVLMLRTNPDTLQDSIRFKLRSVNSRKVPWQSHNDFERNVDKWVGKRLIKDESYVAGIQDWMVARR